LVIDGDAVHCKAHSTVDAGTQTNALNTGSKFQYQSAATPTISAGPPKYSTDYCDPTPIVLPKDTLEGKNKSQSNTHNTCIFLCVVEPLQLNSIILISKQLGMDTCSLIKQLPSL